MLAVVLGMSAACTVHQSEAPPLTGPSGPALSVAVTATRDAITQDGKDTSIVQVFVRDENAKPRAGLELLVSIFPDAGTLLSSRMITGSDGKATTTYTAPPALPPGPSQVTISVSPVLNNAQAQVSGSVAIRLVPLASIPSPPGAPTANFTYVPTTVHKGVDVTFDASSSVAGSGHTVVAYDWDFGDGLTKSRTTPTVTHDFGFTGTYTVTLTVTDEISQTHTALRIVTVVP
jgi:PKD repeat protein